MNNLVLPLNDGATIPQIGLGVMYIGNDELPGVINSAVAMGYRHLDTATHYNNEIGVGRGLSQIEIGRDQMFVTTKLPNSHHGYDEALRAFDESEKKIGRIDLYLIHWPQPPKKKYRQSWQALVRLREEGRVKSIGVSNFLPSVIEELIGDTGVVPAVNQIQLHPAYQQKDVRDYHQKNGIVTEAWSPLEQGRALTHPLIVELARKYSMSCAQIILNWHLQNGIAVIPKAAKPEHMLGNMNASKFKLDQEDMRAIDGMQRPDGRFGPDPMVHFTSP